MKKFLFILALLLVLVVPAHALEPITVYNADGTVLYTEDPAVMASTDAASTATSEFLTKPFEQYSVTEGFLLLFLILAFCWVVWKIIKEVF